MGDDDNSGSDEDVPLSARSTPKIAFDIESMICVPDVRALAELPADTSEEALRTFRAFVFPSGGTMNVPDIAGSYATRSAHTM